MRHFALAAILVASFLPLGGCKGLCLLNDPPTAVAIASPLTGQAPLTVHFTGNASNDHRDNLGAIESYLWNFGDGERSAQENPIHTYEQEGTYTATLVVTDNCQAQDVASLTIEVSAPRANLPPRAFAQAAPTSGPAPLTVAFDASNSFDPDGTIESFSWDFGDGETGEGASVEHTYAEAGEYLATLTATDDRGGQGTLTLSIVVTGEGEPPQEPEPPPTEGRPTAQIQADPVTGKIPLEVTFDGSTSEDPDGVIVSYLWDFDDGKMSSEVSPVHVYEKAGTFNATLTVWDDAGNSSSESVTITVFVR